MKTVAVLTQPLGHNYGGMLQAWALQQVIFQIGFRTTTITRKPNPRSLLYQAARKVKGILLSLKDKDKLPINSPENAILISETRLFIERNIVMSENIFSTDQLRQHFIDNDYYAVIVGSDQVWRPKYSYSISNYFLDFCQDLNLLKLAYAASFGVGEWEFTQRETLTCRNLASSFDAIGVREDSAVNLCQEYLNVNATAVLDPTLLLDSCRYEELLSTMVSEMSQSLEEYICCYLFEIDDLSVDKLFQISMTQGIGLKFANFSGESIGPSLASRIARQEVLPSVEHWLRTFYSATCVITDSFHGMLFSIIFNKPFIVINNNKRGSARFSSILAKINAENRLFSSIDSINLNCLKSPISSDSYSILQGLQSESIDFLYASLRK